jgi:hypothetical protein
MTQILAIIEKMVATFYEETSIWSISFKLHQNNPKLADIIWWTTIVALKKTAGSTCAEKPVPEISIFQLIFLLTIMYTYDS